MLLSSERSGSTLLRVMLGEHSRIAAPQELFLMRYPTFDAWRAEKAEAFESLVELFFLLGQPRTEAAIDAACRGRSSAEVYDWICAQLPSGGLLLDKTPAYANDMATLLRSAALEPFYIWLIRHPLGVVDSHVRLKRAEQRRQARPLRALRPVRDALARLTNGMTAVARERETKWVRQNTNLRTFLRRVPETQHAIVHFEDLVRTPRRALGELCAHIGLRFEPAVLQPQTRQLMNPHLGDPNFHLHAGIDATPAERWRAAYDESVLRDETLQLMTQIGVRSPRLAPTAASADDPAGMALGA